MSVQSNIYDNNQFEISSIELKNKESWAKIIDAFVDDKVVYGTIIGLKRGGWIVEIFGHEAFLPGSQMDINPINNYEKFVGKFINFKIVTINYLTKNIIVSHKELLENDNKNNREKILQKIEKGKVMEGIVKYIAPYGTFVDIGGVDGLIHINDMSYNKNINPKNFLKLGQELNVIVLDFNEDKSRIQLGLKQLATHPWDALNNKLNIGDKVKGKVKIIKDYGVFVEIMEGVEGLIHVSEMSWSSNPKVEKIEIGEEIEAKIVTLDYENHKMSMSIKQLIPNPWDLAEKNYPVGTIQNGVVKNVKNFGAFIELENGIDGLLHISDLSWTNKIKNISDFLKIGDFIDVKVLEINIDERKLNLSHKHTLENPWIALKDQFNIGDTITGIVSEIRKNYIIVEVIDGIEGFISVDEMNWSKKPNKIEKKIKIGEKVEVEINLIDIENQKLILKLKNLLSDNCLNIEKKFPIDSIHKGKVILLQKKTAIIELENKIIGFIDAQDISWNKKIIKPKEILKYGDLIDVKILGLNTIECKLILGHKQTMENPWDILKNKYELGDIICGKVSNFNRNYIIVEVVEGVEGIISISELNWSTKKKNIEKRIKIGEYIEVEIKSMDIENQMLILTLKRLLSDACIYIEQKYPIGSTHKGIVKQLKKNEAIIELEYGIEGFVNVDDISWTKIISKPSQILKLGSEIDVKILDYNSIENKLILGYKQTVLNPLEYYEKKYSIGSIHNGQVKITLLKGAIVLFEKNVKSFVSFDNLQREDGSILKDGEIEKFIVIDFDKKSFAITFSHTATHKIKQ